MRTAAPSNRSRGGFTLLELVLAMGLLAVVVGMVFATARTSLSLGRTNVESQNEEMLHQAFFDLLENRFSSLPGNTRLELAVTESSSHYLSDLTLQNVPLSFTWGGEERTDNTGYVGSHNNTDQDDNRMQVYGIANNAGDDDGVFDLLDDEIIADNNQHKKKIVDIEDG